MTGLHADRLKPKRGNPREVAFASHWALENNHRDVLRRLLEVPCPPNDPQCCILRGENGGWKLPLGFNTERDDQIAATVIQWLGSNVGFSFLQEALGKCGFMIVEK